MDLKDAYVERLYCFIKMSIVIILIVTCVTSVLIPVRVSGASMDKTFHDGDKLVINKMANEIKYKDIIVFYSKIHGGEPYIKRVIGVGGDKIEIKDNNIYLNGNRIIEDYINEPMVTNDYYIEIPKGYVFVMGDNRNKSLDSRDPSLGLVNCEKQIIGKFMCKFF